MYRLKYGFHNISKCVALLFSLLLHSIVHSEVNTAMQSSNHSPLLGETFSSALSELTTAKRKTNAAVKPASAPQKLVVLLNGKDAVDARVTTAVAEQELLAAFADDARIKKLVVSRPYCPPKYTLSDSVLVKQRQIMSCEREANIALVVEMYANSDDIAEISSELIARFPNNPKSIAPPIYPGQPCVLESALAVTRGPHFR